MSQDVHKFTRAMTWRYTLFLCLLAAISMTSYIREKWMPAVTLMILFFVGLFIFRPMIRRMRREMERLSEAETYNQSIIDSALDAIIVTDASGRITSWNPQAENIFGWKQTESLQKKISDLIIPCRYRETFERELKHFNSMGTGNLLNKRIEMTALHRHDYEFPIEISVSPMKVDGKSIFSYFLRNISDRKEAEEKLKRANEELIRLNQIKSEFTSMVSHELRTPLTAIKEGIALVLDGIDGPVTLSQKETLEIAKNNVDRLARLINNVLDFTKLESGKMEMTFIKTDMNLLVMEIYDLMKLAVQKKGIKFSVALPPQALLTTCDSDKVKQVLINLVDNAIKFTDKEGKIEIRLSQLNQREIQMEVEDSGVGIRKEDQNKIFEMFGQAYHQGMWKTGGSGVGLAVCKRIIYQHKGHIHVESTFKKGTRFYFTLPLETPPLHIETLNHQIKQTAEMT